MCHGLLQLFLLDGCCHNDKHCLSVMRDAPWYPVVKIIVTTEFNVDTRRDWGVFAGILIGGNNLKEAPGWSITQRSVEC